MNSEELEWMVLANHKDIHAKIYWKIAKLEKRVSDLEKMKETYEWIKKGKYKQVVYKIHDDDKKIVDIPEDSIIISKERDFYRTEHKRPGSSPGCGHYYEDKYYWKLTCLVPTNEE